MSISLFQNHHVRHLALWSYVYRVILHFYSKWEFFYKWNLLLMQLVLINAWMGWGRDGQFDSYLKWALSVCFAGNMGEPVLLPVWFPFPCVHHPGHLGVADLHRHGLLPALWWGKKNQRYNVQIKALIDMYGWSHGHLPALW